jgi:polyhydroxybutyrate depolymerase
VTRAVFLVLIVAACSKAPGDQPDASTPDGGGASDGAVAACSDRTAQPLDATWSLMVGGVARQTDVHVPASYDPTRATPVVINLHGLASSGSDQASVTHMIAKSDAEGFIAVHPDGTGSPKGWNAGACCNPAASSGIDDTAFVAALIDELSAKLCLDPRRVFASGFSNGGFLAHQVACRLADRIAAIGAVSGVLGIDDCSPARPVAVMHVHGTGDFVIPYNGGGINNNLSVDATIQAWVAFDHCTAAPMTTYTNGDATCVDHAGCADGTDVTLCTIDGGGHQWPGGESVGPLNGKLSDNLIATDAIWAFFQAHPMP